MNKKYFYFNIIIFLIIYAFLFQYFANLKSKIKHAGSTYTKEVTLYRSGFSPDKIISDLKAQKMKFETFKKNFSQRSSKKSPDARVYKNLFSQTKIKKKTTIKIRKIVKRPVKKFKLKTLKELLPEKKKIYSIPQFKILGFANISGKTKIFIDYNGMISILKKGELLKGKYKFTDIIDKKVIFLDIETMTKFKKPLP